MKPSDCQDLDLQTWLAFLRVSGRKPKTLVHYSHCLRGLHTFVNHPLSMVTRAEALAWAAHLAETHAPAGRASFIRSARTFYSWLVNEEIIDRSPFARMKISVPESVKRTPDMDAIDALITKARSKRDRCILVMLADTGARKGEIASPRVEDVDLDHATIYIRESKTRKRPVAVSNRLIVAMGRWLRQRGPTPGSLWDCQDLYSLIGAVVKRTSASTLSPHDFRRAFAVRWLEDGKSEVGLQRIAGWSSSAMIRTYTAAKADEIALAEHRRFLAS
jgi:integrase